MGAAAAVEQRPAPRRRHVPAELGRTATGCRASIRTCRARTDPAGAVQVAARRRAVRPAHRLLLAPWLRSAEALRARRRRLAALLSDRRTGPSSSTSPGPSRCSSPRSPAPSSRSSEDRPGRHRRAGRRAWRASSTSCCCCRCSRSGRRSDGGGRSASRRARAAGGAAVARRRTARPVARRGARQPRASTSRRRALWLPGVFAPSRLHRRLLVPARGAGPRGVRARLSGRLPRTPSGLALGSGFVIWALDLANKQSFFNHYMLPLGSAGHRRRGGRSAGPSSMPAPTPRAESRPLGGRRR